jgi:hypothetical protein
MLSQRAKPPAGMLLHQLFRGILLSKLVRKIIYWRPSYSCDHEQAVKLLQEAAFDAKEDDIKVRPPCTT